MIRSGRMTRAIDPVLFSIVVVVLRVLIGLEPELSTTIGHSRMVGLLEAGLNGASARPSGTCCPHASLVCPKERE